MAKKFSELRAKMSPESQARSAALSDVPAQRTYFGLFLEKGGVRLSEIQEREFFHRWKTVMGDVRTTTLPNGEKIVSLVDVERFAQLYVLEI